MSWRQNSYSNQPFNPHGGRNAFRGNDGNDDDPSSADRAASFRAMRSFTQSIECDDLPTAPELPAELDIDQIEGLKNSDTNDTIIEVIKPKKPDVDPQLGETQKYKMTVPGPGHSEQEQELHKSLIDAEEDELDMEIEHAMSQSAGNKEKRAPPSAFARNIGSADNREQDSVRREYNNVAVQRPRPTTPTSQCTIETLAFVGAGDTTDVKPDEKIKVSIPSARRRRSDMSYSDFYDNMSQQIPNQARGVMSGRTTPINNYDGDILEEDPNYKSKAPPAPVVHRRSSMDWENFEDHKERLQMESSEQEKPPSIKKKASTPDDEDEPKFSEDMQEERQKIRQARKSAGSRQEPSSPGDQVVPTTEEDTAMLKKERLSEQLAERAIEKAAAEAAAAVASEAEAARNDQIVPNEQPDQETEIVSAEKDMSPEPEKTVAEQPDTTEDVSGNAEPERNCEEAGEQTYDPNAYPGYIWNYETQQWDVDPNYVPSDNQTYDYSQTGDQTYYQDGQQANYDQYYAGYDQTAYDQGSTTQYDYTTAAYHAGYDQGNADSYNTNYNYGNDTYSSESYNQTGYDQNSEYNQNAGYDQSNYSAGYDQPGYDQTATTAYDYTTAAYHAGYDQSGNETTYPAYDQSSTEATTNQYNGYDQSTEGNSQYSGQQTATGYDEQTSGYNNQDSSYRPAASGSDTSSYQAQQQSSAAVDQSSYATPAPYTNAYQPYDYSQEQQYSSSYYDSYNYSDYNQSGYNQNYDNQYQQNDDYYNNASEPSTQPPARPEPPPFIVPDFGGSSWQEKEPEDAEPEKATEKAEPARAAPPSRPAPPKAGKQEEEPKEQEEIQASAAAPPPRPPPAAKGPPPRPQAPHPANIPEKEDDAWTAFKKMTEKVTTVVKSTEEQLKNLSETTAANDIKDESYLSQVGGEQGYVHNTTQREIQKRLEEQKNAKLLKKKLKQQGKKAASPTFDPDEEDNMDRAAQELAAKLAAKMNMEMGTVPATSQVASSSVSAVSKEEELERSDSLSGIPPRQRSSLKEAQQDSGGSLELPSHLNSQQRDSIVPKGDLDPCDPILAHPAWTDFETGVNLPPSESGFFGSKEVAPPPVERELDPFAPPDRSLIDATYDPFAVAPAEDIVAAAKAKAAEVQQACQGKEDVDFYAPGRQSPPLSSPTPEGGSPISHRPDGFDDNFKCDDHDGDTPTPLYDEDDSQPLVDFIPKYEGEGWELMVRHPIKKKSFMAERCWKPCFVRMHGNTLIIFNNKSDNKPIQELLLQGSYSLSDTTLQAYDIYGKIHTVKLQYVQYKEKVGIRPGQISRLVDGHITKYGLPLEHSGQCNVLLKFGSLNASELQCFVNAMEDILFKCPAKRESKPIYKQDEVQVHCYDEYTAYVDKDGIVSDQKARVRMFCLAFVTGSPFLEIGLNDRRRQGKEIVRRKDILPMYTERWIRFENLEFHNTVDQDAFEKEQVIRLSPPDGSFFEIMRFRVRPPKNREKFLNIKCIMKIAGSKVEIRLEVMASAQVERSKGGKSTKRQIPCEDIAIKFPIPEAWIYIFREERHWGVGSVHSKKLRPGKVKNLKDRLLGAVQSNEPNLIEVAIGEAKYEHVFRSLVWRIPRLPEKHHSAYKSHLLKCRFELSSFDLMPETFLPRCDVDFTMPLATVSNTVVRSVSVEQHEDSDRVEKFVRYVAKCQYKVEIDYVQCADLEVDTLDPSLNPEEAMNMVPELHQPAFQPGEVDDMHDGYRIDLPERPEGAANDSSSDDDDDKGHKMPIIQIDMKNYGY